MRHLALALCLLALAACDPPKHMSDEDVSAAVNHCKKLGLEMTYRSTWFGDAEYVTMVNCLPPSRLGQFFRSDR